MTISMQYKSGGTWYDVSSNIKFTGKTPWQSEPKITTHEIDGADHDILYHRGRHSRSSNISGYCARTSANVLALESLKDGRTVRVRSTVNDTDWVQGMVTSLQISNKAGELFVGFSMTVVEQ